MWVFSSCLLSGVDNCEPWSSQCHGEVGSSALAARQPLRSDFLAPYAVSAEILASQGSRFVGSETQK